MVQKYESCDACKMCREILELKKEENGRANSEVCVIAQYVVVLVDSGILWAHLFIAANQGLEQGAELDAVLYQLVVVAVAPRIGARPT